MTQRDEANRAYGGGCGQSVACSRGGSKTLKSARLHIKERFNGLPERRAASGNKSNPIGGRKAEIRRVNNYTQTTHK